jgi:hypothetical protein
MGVARIDLIIFLAIVALIAFRAHFRRREDWRV